MVTRTRALLAMTALALATALSGCGSDGSPTSDGTGEPSQPSQPSDSPTPTKPSTPPTSPGTPAPPIPTPPGTPTLPKPPPPAGVEVDLDGVVEPGVEAGCRILKTDSGDYLLLGEPEDGEQVPLGVPVRVRGMITDEMFSFCQQGIPFTIVDVTRR